MKHFIHSEEAEKTFTEEVNYNDAYDIIFNKK